MASHEFFSFGDEELDVDDGTMPEDDRSASNRRTALADPPGGPFGEIEDTSAAAGLADSRGGLASGPSVRNRSSLRRRVLLVGLVLLAAFAGLRLAIEVVGAAWPAASTRYAGGDPHPSRSLTPSSARRRAGIAAERTRVSREKAVERERARRRRSTTRRRARRSRERRAALLQRRDQRGAGAGSSGEVSAPVYVPAVPEPAPESAPEPRPSQPSGSGGGGMHDGSTSPEFGL